MDLATFFNDLQNGPVGVWVNTAGPAYPIIETFHVIALSLVFGTILVVDLRLLGFASMSRPFTRVAHDLLRVTWAGFALAVVTGVLLFVPNAGSLYMNLPFQIKMILLLLAGFNMFVFELITARNVGTWDLTSPPPNSARIAGLLSITLWTAVLVCGRLIGFTAQVSEDPFAMLS
jgi:hypothetical protein